MMYKKSSRFVCSLLKRKLVGISFISLFFYTLNSNTGNYVSLCLVRICEAQGHLKEKKNNSLPVESA